jgi:hypothetical protein
VLKTLGYTVSGLSVMLLAIPAWKGASESPLLLAALLAGMATSVGGMLLRWLSFLKDRRIMHDLERARPRAPLTATRPASGDQPEVGAGKRRVGAGA